jgi:hypothetical protein
MKRLLQGMVLGLSLLALSACSSTEGDKGSFSGDDMLYYTAPAMSGQTPVANGIAIRITPFTDKREEKNPQRLGVITTRVFGLSGNSLVLDRNVVGVATDIYKRHFQKAGFEVLDDGATKMPAFELSGVVKRLTLNTKDRDEIDVAIETSLTEVSTGKVIWSALVSEKSDRFAGVSGNSKSDLVSYLNRGVGIVAGKTVDAVNALLMASYPALFNLTPGTKSIAGVTVYSAPIVPAHVAAVGTVAVAPVVAAPVVSVVTTGTLRLSSKPSRAKVYLDGIYFGLTPLHAEIDAGVHEVEVKLDGYKSVSEKVSVRKADTTELELSLKR